MSDYQGLLRTCHIKRKKGEDYDFRLKSDSKRKGNVSFWKKSKNGAVF